jgi:hypothetical protein
LFDTIELIFNNESIKALNPESFVLLSLEFPFLQSKMIDNSIRSAIIFEADTVISVRLDSCSHYKHNGSTMLSLHNNALTKYERDDLYVAKGGVTYSSYSNLLKNKRLPSGKISHIIVDQISAIEIVTAIDLLIANYLDKKFSISKITSVKIA